MKTATRFLPLVLCLASPATLAAGDPDSMLIDCDHIALPSQQDFARIAGSDNFGQIYARRARAMADVQRGCQKGAARVMLVLDRHAPDARRVTVVAAR